VKQSTIYTINNAAILVKISVKDIFQIHLFVKETLFPTLKILPTITLILERWYSGAARNLKKNPAEILTKTMVKVNVYNVYYIS